MLNNLISEDTKYINPSQEDHLFQGRNANAQILPLLHSLSIKGYHDQLQRRRRSHQFVLLFKYVQYRQTVKMNFHLPMNAMNTTGHRRPVSRWVQTLIQVMFLNLLSRIVIKLLQTNKEKCATNG